MDLLPYTPDKTGYAATPGYGCVEIPLPGGPSRKRQTVLFSAHYLQCSWIVRASEYTQFQAFFQDHDNEDFLADLVTDIHVPTRHVCRVIGGLPKLTKQSGDAYYASCTIEADYNHTFTGEITYTETGRIVVSLSDLFSPFLNNARIPQTFQIGDTIRVIGAQGTLSSRRLDFDGEYVYDSSGGQGVFILDSPSSVSSAWVDLVDAGSDIAIDSTITNVPS